jgi:methionyl-tRNA formyltransferase
MISIVFFGSGPVAAKSLKLLVQNFEIEAVITKPKPSHHHGDFPVIELAKTLGLKIYTPSNKKELTELFASNPVRSKIGLVIDYGLIITQEVIDYFPLGIINSHFSLLPEWRGADPITFSVLSGQKRTGVSLMLITAGLDEGPLLAQTPFDIPNGITAPKLTDALIELSHISLAKILPIYMNGDISPAPQEQVTIAASATPTYSRKLTKKDGIIDWNKPAEQIEREIRAFIDWPKSTTILAGKEVIVTSAKVIDESGTPGQPVARGKELIVYCGDQALSLGTLKPNGKKEMTAAAFLAGYGRLFKV